MMHIAQAVQAAIGPIATEAIMDTGSVEVGQDINRLQGITSALAMNGVVSEGLGRGRMHPPALPLHIEAGFIMVEHLCLS